MRHLHLYHPISPWSLFGWGVLLLLLTACTATTSDATIEGQAVYSEYCARCHGADGEGQANWQQPNPDGTWLAPPHNDTGHTWHHPDAQLLMTINDGRNQMPAFRDTLTPAQQAAVLAYIKTFWSKDHRAVQADVTRQWQEQYE